MWWTAESKGELEVAGMRLFGASSKRGDSSKIGFFGSGFKYALAVLLREGATVRVFSGEREVVIGTRAATLRGQAFQEITIGGEGTGITTAVGPQWEPWMAVREVVCNALDEGEEVFGTRPEVRGAAGRTTVAISHEHVRHVVDEWSKYFRLGSEGTTVTRGGAKVGRVLPKVGREARIYRRGILVHVDQKEALCDYEVDDLLITEERTARGWEVGEKVFALLQDAPLAVKKEVLLGGREFEHAVASNYVVPSMDWADALEGRMVATKEQVAFHGEDVRRHDPLVIPDAWVSALRKVPGVRTVEKVLKDRARPKGERDHKDPRRTHGEDGAALRDALALLRSAGIVIEEEDVVLVDKFSDDSCGVQGTWTHEDGKIRVLRTLRGIELLHTLLHEWAHRESGASDRTRQFERFLGTLAARLLRGKGKLR